MQCIPDHFMNIFRIVFLVHDIQVRFSRSMALFDQFFSIRDIMDRVLRDLTPVMICLYWYRLDKCFQEQFSCLPISKRIIVAGIRARKPTNRQQYREPFTPSKKNNFMSRLSNRLKINDLIRGQNFCIAVKSGIPCVAFSA